MGEVRIVVVVSRRDPVAIAVSDRWGALPATGDHVHGVPLRELGPGVVVVHEIPDARFVILGEGELREQLERQVRDHHLEKHVFLPGFRTDVLGCIKGFDVFAMSSVTEGLGTSLLDAMACSKPIVATSVGGIPEVVVDGDTGLLVAPRNHAAMADAIVRLLTDEGLRGRMGEAGLARVRERFTVERMVSETAAVYARVAGRPHATDTASLSARG